MTHANEFTSYLKLKDGNVPDCTCVSTPQESDYLLNLEETLEVIVPNNNWRVYQNGRKYYLCIPENILQHIQVKPWHVEAYVAASQYNSVNKYIYCGKPNLGLYNPQLEAQYPCLNKITKVHSQNGNVYWDEQEVEEALVDYFTEEINLGSSDKKRTIEKMLAHNKASKEEVNWIKEKVQEGKQISRSWPYNDYASVPETECEVLKLEYDKIYAYTPRNPNAREGLQFLKKKKEVACGLGLIKEAVLSYYVYEYLVNLCSQGVTNFLETAEEKLICDLADMLKFTELERLNIPAAINNHFQLGESND